MFRKLKTIYLNAGVLFLNLPLKCVHYPLQCSVHFSVQYMKTFVDCVVYKSEGGQMISASRV